MMAATSVVCQAAVESGKVSYNPIVRQDGTEVSVSPFGRETHSTTAFNGVAVIVPCDFSGCLPRSFSSAGCRESLEELAGRIGRSDRRKVIFIPFA